MHAIETHEIAPSAAFLWKDTLYLRYNYEGQPFYFTAPARADRKKGEEYSLLTPKRADGEKLDNKASQVVLVGREWTEIVKDVLLSLLPQNPGEGRLIFIRNYETLLFRRDDGTPDLAELAKAPASVQVVGVVRAEEFDRLLFEELKSQVQASGAPYTRFLLRMDHVPLTPFLYVDTEQNLMTPLQLPPYYELEKEMSDLGFSAGFFWSFFVKSHVFGVLKAPFTSSFRLLSLAESSVYTALPPLYGDLKEVPPLQTSGEEMDLAEFNSWLSKKITKQNYKASVKLLVDGGNFSHILFWPPSGQNILFLRAFIFLLQIRMVSK